MSEYEPHGPQRPRLSDEEFADELDAREYEPTTALVKRSKGKSRGAEWIKNKREQIREEQQLAQFYLVTTTDKKKRAVIKRFADALTEESDEAIAAREVLCDRALCDLVARIVADPCLLGDIETALDSLGDAERGRRTSEPEVAGLIDALLDDTDLQDLVRAAVEVESGFAKVLGAAIGDEMLRRAVLALTSNPDSDLARNADHRLLYHVPREACPLRLAPTASTTAALALGDALAMVLLESRGVTRDDFAKYHPAGNLGRQLLLHVRDIMRAGDRLPVAPDTVTTQDAILRMTKAKSGSIALVHPKTGKLTGILTDGDFRRSALTGPDFLRQPVAAFMTRQPKTIRDHALGVDALRLFETYKIDDLIVVDGRGRPVGLIDGQDLPKLKIV